MQPYVQTYCMRFGRENINVKADHSVLARYYIFKKKE